MTRIRKLSTPPTRQDPATFASRGDTFLSDLLGWAADANTLADELNALKLANDLSVTSSAAQAAAARDAALAAWGASMAPAEVLPAISRQLHSGAIVKSILYDTSKDSDGGAWRKRCQDKSWFNESLNGTWLGQAANAATAWALSGAVTGAYFQNTTDGKFYALGAASPNVTEVFRGNKAEFPAQVAIVAESSRIIIYDLTQSNCPMWMVFIGLANQTTYLGYSVATRPLTSVAAINGTMCSTSNLGAVGVTSFVGDTGSFISVTNSNIHTLGISARNSVQPVGNALPNILSSTVNDVAMTVLPDAPVDVATGLPIPTIAVATTGGISIIKSDGSVANDTSTGGANVNTTSILFTKEGRLVRNFGTDYRRLGIYNKSEKFPLFSQSSDAVWDRFGDTPTNLGAPYTPSLSAKYIAETRSAIAAANAGLSLIQYNPSNRAASAIAYITNAYNTGWMVGDIRGAWLADIVPEVLPASGNLSSAANYVVPSTYDNTLSGVTDSGATAVAGTTASRIAVNVSTTANKTYVVTATLTGAPASGTVSASVRSLQNGGGSDLVTPETMSLNTQVALTFVATGATSSLIFTSSASAQGFTVSSISCKLAEPDRSVKNNGLIVNGSITKAAVATNAQLVGYSGFSTVNYLEQPYNANLDFGTGDFCVMGWMSLSSIPSALKTLFCRSSNPFGGGSVQAYLNTDQTVTFTTSLTGFASGNVAATSSLTIPVGPYVFICFVRRSGFMEIWINAVKDVSSVSNTQDLTNTTAVLRIGARQDTSLANNISAFALWRAGATAPSADQIAYIYNTEKHLFDANAKCVIDGTGTAVTALAYDENEDALHVGTSWGRSKFRDLVRVESALTAGGSITSLSAGQGCHITGGASAAKFYQPAFYLREELRRKEEARRALGRTPTFFDFDTIGLTATTTNGSNQLTSVSVTTGMPYIGMGITGAGIPAGTTITNINGATYTISANATASASGVALAQNTFNVPKGFATKAVYSAGTLKRLGSTKDYVINTDGFVETAVFGVSPGNAAWVSIMATRSN